MGSNTDLESSSTPQAPNTRTPQQEYAHLVGEVYDLIKDLGDAKKDFEKFSSSQQEKFLTIESQLASIDKAKSKAISLIEKETKSYDIIITIWWYFFVGAIISFFVLPIIGFILLYNLSSDIVLDKFSNFFASWLAYLCAGVGVILLGGFQNLYRRINLLQKEIDRIKKI